MKSDLVLRTITDNTMSFMFIVVQEEALKDSEEYKAAEEVLKDISP